MIEQDIVHAIKPFDGRISVRRLDALDDSPLLGGAAFTSLRYESSTSRGEISGVAGEALKQSTLPRLDI